jgi:uncharacterized protein (TIGR00725 family)
MRITVFGGSQPQPGSPAYLDAEALGRALGELGHTVLTGGYCGTMEAASRGASNSGAHVIGVTCAELERSHHRTVNQWVAEEWKKETLLSRIESLVLNCDAALALPGGPGTLTELAVTWNMMIIRALKPRPLILIGAGWHAVIDTLLRELGQYTPPSQREFISFAPDTGSAVEMIKKMHL